MNKKIRKDKRGISLQIGDDVCFLHHRLGNTSQFVFGKIISIDRYIKVETEDGIIVEKLTNSLLKLPKTEERNR